MYSKLLDHLIEIVNNSDKLKVEYGITGQEIKYDDDNKLITFSCNTDMEVNYFEQTATRNIIKSDFYGTIKTTESYENRKKISSNEKENMEFSKEEYENLFKPGGILYPIDLQQLIPVDSQMNNKGCQVCIPSSQLVKNIPGYIKSTYAIYEKNEKLYDITMIMNQLDEKTEIPLMQYCNIKIYIL